MKKLETGIIIVNIIMFIITLSGIFAEAFNREYNGFFHLYGLYFICFGLILFAIPYIIFYTKEILGGRI